MSVVDANENRPLCGGDMVSLNAFLNDGDNSQRTGVSYASYARTCTLNSHLTRRRRVNRRTLEPVAGGSISFFNIVLEGHGGL